MRLGTARDGDRTRAFVTDGAVTRFYDAVDVGDLITRPMWRDLPFVESATPREEDLLPPVLRPGKIICAGLNYYAHAAEVGKVPPAVPTLFAKFATSLTSPRGAIEMPPSDEVDWEAELAIVIGRRARGIEDDSTARDAILGYSIVNDVSARDWQRRTSEWLQGKNFDRTTPFGPVIVTPDEVDPVQGLAIECFVDGDVRQSGSTADMIFGPAELVRYISGFLTLEPGDLIATGTPAGVGSGRRPPLFLRPGQVLTTRIAGIGELVNHCEPARRYN